MTIDASPRRRWPLVAAALFVITAWGASFVLTRIALSAFDPLDLVAVRTVVGAVVVLGLARALGRRALPGRGALTPTLLLGLTLAVHLLIQAHGLIHTTAVHTGWIIGFIPVVITVGSVLFLRQRVSGRAWIGVAIATVGVLLVVAQQPPDFHNARFGDLLQLVSCVTWAAYTLLAVRPVARHGSLAMTGGAFVVAGVVLAVPAAADGQLLAAPPSAAALTAVALLSVVASGIAYVLWFRVLDGLGAPRTGAFLYLEPFATLITARLLLAEPVTLLGLVGGLTVLAGVALIQRDRP